MKGTAWRQAFIVSPDSIMSLLYFMLRVPIGCPFEEQKSSIERHVFFVKHNESSRLRKCLSSTYDRRAGEG